MRFEHNGVRHLLPCVTGPDIEQAGTPSSDQHCCHVHREAGSWQAGWPRATLPCRGSPGGERLPDPRCGFSSQVPSPRTAAGKHHADAQHRHVVRGSGHFQGLGGGAVPWELVVPWEPAGAAVGMESCQALSSQASAWDPKKTCEPASASTRPWHCRPALVGHPEGPAGIRSWGSGREPVVTSSPRHDLPPALPLSS